MRFTIIGPAYPLRGGIAHHVYWLARELTRHRHDVQVISFRTLYPRWFFPGTTVFDDSDLKLEANAAPVLRPFGPLTWLKANRMTRAFAPDLVIVQWWNPFFAPALGTLIRMLRNSGLRCVMECHNVFPHESSWFDAALVRYALSPAERFIAHSQDDRETILKISSTRPVDIAPLPALDVFSGVPGSDRAGRTILFFGIVRKYKGLEVLLLAMRRVIAKIDCRLIIAGEFYEPVGRFKELVSEYGIDRNVVIEDRYIPNEEVAMLFSKADVLVLPYLSATQSAVARIALSNGLPIIASRTGGLKEVIDENVDGLLVPPGDPDALADCIINYFEGGLGPRFAANLKSARPPEAGVARLIEAIAS